MDDAVNRRVVEIARMQALTCATRTPLAEYDMNGISAILRWLDDSRCEGVRVCCLLYFVIAIYSLGCASFGCYGNALNKNGEFCAVIFTSFISN